MPATIDPGETCQSAEIMRVDAEGVAVGQLSLPVVSLVIRLAQTLRDGIAEVRPTVRVVRRFASSCESFDQGTVRRRIAGRHLNGSENLLRRFSFGVGSRDRDLLMVMLVQQHGKKSQAQTKDNCAGTKPYGLKVVLHIRCIEPGRPPKRTPRSVSVYL